MLRTNSKQARENVRRYIIENYDGQSVGYDNTPPTSAPWEHIAAFILETFHDEKLRHDLRYKAGRISEYTLFVEWCSGLPSVLDTCYYYNRSAVDDLGTILDETETERARYSERDAEQLLTKLIYNEIIKGAANNA